MRAIVKPVRITPKTHMLWAIRNAEHWNYAKALSELVDNSFGYAAGDAQNVTITVGANHIIVEDDGVGIDKIERLFTIGDSLSRYSKDIGTYGMGAKAACIWMCDRVLVETRRDGLKVFAEMNWKRLMDEEPEEFPELKPIAETLPAGAPTGTRIHLQGFAHKRSLHIDALCRMLGETYAMALKVGKTIRVIDERHKARGEETREFLVEPFIPPGLSGVERIAGNVGGKRYSAEIGVLTEQVGRASGIRFCYGHRVIEIKSVLDGRSIPARVFGYVMLETEWKEHLSTNKTELIDAEDLERDLLTRCAAVFELAAEWERDLNIDELAAALSRSMSSALRADATGDKRGLRKPTNEGTDAIDAHPSPPVLPEPTGDKPAVEKPKEAKRGVHIKIVKNGIDSPIGSVGSDEKGLTVSLNEDSPLVRRAIESHLSSGMRYSASFIQVIGLLIAADSARRGESYCAKVFGENVMGDAKELQELYDQILIWWSRDATASLWNSESSSPSEN